MRKSVCFPFFKKGHEQLLMAINTYKDTMSSLILDVHPLSGNDLLEKPSYQWICNNETLAHFCQRWSTLRALALDTEFVRTDTFYPLPGLVQVNTGTMIYLIDPLTIDCWAPLRDLLENPGVVKVLHACGEDLDVLYILAGATPRPLFDTQLMAAFAGLGYSLGYQKLVNTLLGIEIPKDETRSNWRQRPLTSAQESYAALDVVHLLAVYDAINNRLMGLNAKRWGEEDCSHLQSTLLRADITTAWKGVKRAWQLNRQQLGVLKALCLYQETQARQRNVPKTRVIPKGSLWPLARYQPDNLKSLAGIADMKPGIVKKDGECLLSIIEEAANQPKASYPSVLPKPLPKETRIMGKRIKAIMEKLATELRLPVQILLPSTVTTAILRRWIITGRLELPDHLQGWRREVIGRPLIEQLHQQD